MKACLKKGSILSLWTLKQPSEVNRTGMGPVAGAQQIYNLKGWAWPDHVGSIFGKSFNWDLIPELNWWLKLTTSS